MKAKTNSPASYHRLTRRQVVTGAAIAIGGMVANSSLLAASRQQPARETPGSSPNSTRTSLHDEIVVNTSPQRIYQLLLDSKQFASLTGAPAEIDPKAGGAFSMFGGLIVGRNIELVPHQRIVQRPPRRGMERTLLATAQEVFLLTADGDRGSHVLGRECQATHCAPPGSAWL